MTIKVPTRITCNSNSVIDHILVNYPERVIQKVIIDVGLPEHQLIFCTRKISTRINEEARLLTELLFQDTLTMINFPNYKNINDATDIYNDFIQKIIVAF